MQSPPSAQAPEPTRLFSRVPPRPVRPGTAAPSDEGSWRAHRSTGAAYPEITFIDDKVSHLDAVAHLGVACGLATWGYNGEREIALARQRGYLVLGLDDVEAQIFP